MKSFNLKSFILGIVAGIVLTFVVLAIYGVAHVATTTEVTETVNSGNEPQQDNDPIHYLEKPVSYEHKTETYFKVFQVLDGAALANEISEEGINMFTGNVVLIKGKDFYTDQVLKVKNPQRIGTFSYENQRGMDMTVPIIEGEIQQ